MHEITQAMPNILPLQQNVSVRLSHLGQQKSSRCSAQAMNSFPCHVDCRSGSKPSICSSACLQCGELTVCDEQRDELAGIAGVNVAQDNCAQDIMHCILGQLLTCWYICPAFRTPALMAEGLLEALSAKVVACTQASNVKTQV